MANRNIIRKPINAKLDVYPMQYINSKIYSSQLPADGLVAEYLLNGNALDTSGNSKDLTVLDAFVYVNNRDGDSNSAANNGYANIEQQLVDTNSDFTISCWINNNASGSDGDRIWSFSSNNTNDGLISLYRFGLDYILNLVDDSGNDHTQYFGFGSISDIWRHIIVIRESNFWKVRVDNNEVANISANNHTTVRFSLGIYYRNGSQVLQPIDNTIVDDVRIYSRALAENEITALYNE